MVKPLRKLWSLTVKLYLQAFFSLHLAKYHSKSDGTILATVVCDNAYRLFSQHVYNRRENSVYERQGYSHDSRVVQCICTILTTVKHFYSAI